MENIIQQFDEVIEHHQDGSNSISTTECQMEKEVENRLSMNSTGGNFSHCQLELVHKTVPNSTSPITVPFDEQPASLISSNIASSTADLQSAMSENMTHKKDSGYGSQGLLRLDKVRLLETAGMLNKQNYLSSLKKRYNSTESHASESSSPGSPTIPLAVITPKEEKDLKDYYEHLNLK